MSNPPASLSGLPLLLLLAAACTAPRRAAPPAGTCPDGYILVGGNPDLDTRDFCVARFEMKERAGKPVSQAAGKPWMQVSRDEAVALCASLGPGYALISNDQWQTLARDIESVAANWSSGQVGAGALNMGNFSTELGGAVPDDPCATEGFPTRFPGCRKGGSPDFARKRDHVLSSGETIWDMGGNTGEWTSTSVGAELPGDFRGRPCSAPGPYRRHFGSAGSYPGRCDEHENSLGLGYIEGSGGSVIFRGGGAGSEGSAWATCPGVFYANTNSYWDASRPGPGFRCVRRPAAR
jgi:formylglycine-generating enzyme required for sulfatase activity